MIKLNQNYSIDTDSTHGFILLFESDPVKKEVTTKEGKEIREIITKDNWYYPKLSQALNKFFSLSIAAESQKELIEKVIKVEHSIENFNKTFAKKGKIFEL